MEPKPKHHPNRVPFRGVLARLDEPSDGIPGGCEGHRLIMSTEAAAGALDTLIGMGVGFARDLSSHDRRMRCGVITEAEIVGKDLWVRGHLFCFDFPELQSYIGNPDIVLGMSYELVDAKVVDKRPHLRDWTLRSLTFTGAAILLRNKAAYHSSSFIISAAAEQPFNGHVIGLGGAIELLEVCAECEGKV